MLAALLAYALLFQSITAGIAGGQMAGMHISGHGVSCETSGSGHQDHGGGRLWHECCAVLCQVACGSGIASISSDHGAYVHPEPRDIATLLPREGIDLRSPHHWGLCREARAPPHRSV